MMKIISSLLSSSLLALILATTHAASIHLNNGAEDSSESQEQSEKPAVLKLYENSHVTKYSIPRGTLIKVILEFNPSTGFFWGYQSSDVLEYLNEKAIMLRPLKKHLRFPIVGAPLEKSWTFKATNSGETMLTFALTRPWEKEVSPLKTVQFDITVE
jgi:inhibitor of cysteine peptidase